MKVPFLIFDQCISFEKRSTGVFVKRGLATYFHAIVYILTKPHRSNKTTKDMKRQRMITSPSITSSLMLFIEKVIITAPMILFIGDQSNKMTSKIYIL